MVAHVEEQVLDRLHGCRDLNPAASREVAFLFDRVLEPRRERHQQAIE